MAAEGVRLIAHVDQLAVMGFAEVFSRLPYFIRLLRRVRASFASERPSLVLPIDYPGFNMRMARSARALGIPVLYYIAPQVWAWHRSRVHDLARSTDALAVILPFEEAIFRSAGARATFVGHPLLDRQEPTADRTTFLARLGLDPTRPVLALFPGSRAQEVQRHGVLFAETARRLNDTRPHVQAVVGAGAAVPFEAVARMGLPVTSDGWTLLHHAQAALVKSGTGTLEAALAGTPLVIAYRMHGLTFALAKRLVRVEHVGLVNLVAGERVAPEYIQDEATPERLAQALQALLEPDGPERRRALEGIGRVRNALRAPGNRRPAAERVVDLADTLMGEGEGA
jgi:lipid-A-disaccharide synthase